MKQIKYFGVRVITDQGVVPKFIRSSLFKGNYEIHELNLIETILRKGDRVLEIGAGVGVVSLVATKLVGEGLVFSYEANRGLEPLIRHNYDLNNWKPNITMLPVTVDGRDIELYYDERVVSTSMYDRGLKTVKQLTSSIAISEVFEMTQPNVLVMDVEGAEVELLAQKCVAQVHDIIVEMHPHIIGERAVDSLTNSLHAKGFELKKILHKTYHFSQ